MKLYREQAEDMLDAHLEGLHDDLPREGCPECEGRDLKDYPRAPKLPGGQAGVLADPDRQWGDPV